MESGISSTYTDIRSVVKAHLQAARICVALARLDEEGTMGVAIDDRYTTPKKGVSFDNSEGATDSSQSSKNAPVVSVVPGQVSSSSDKPRDSMSGPSGIAAASTWKSDLITDIYYGSFFGWLQSVDELRDFVVLNYLAVHKILKKHDKLTGRNLQVRTECHRPLCFYFSKKIVIIAEILTHKILYVYV